MKIRNIACAAAIASSLIALTSCNEWLKEENPGETKLEDFFTSGASVDQTVTGCYTPLAWEFQSTYYSEWFFGDIASDDALKGGQNISDGTDAYDIDNFKTNVSNGIVLDYYRAKYQGIGRCNLALELIPGVEPDETMTERRKECYLGEVYFLRAFYYFQLVRLFGGVPLITSPIESADKWHQPRATVEETYALIISDLLEAEKRLYNKVGDGYEDADLGRATKGAAQALLCKVYLYMKDYQEAYKWGKKWYDEQFLAGQYSLCPVYADNFTLAGENGPESVFEIQYIAEGTSDFGQGNGFSRGTFSTRMMRPRYGNDSGWGWNHPTQNLYDEFEPGDVRREVAIGIPPAEYINDAEVSYLGDPYYNNKYAFMVSNTEAIPLDHHSRSPLNYKLMRAADILLLYAEAALETGNSAVAREMLELVRSRARANATEANALPEFPNYNGYSNDDNSLRQALRHERRVELAMEGHRWFDIVRWGIAKQILDKDTGSYGSHESDAVRAEMANFVEGKHELFPIPFEEIQLNPVDQNPGY